MQVKIKNIHIQGFRGIPDLELELDGKSMLLKGENGTGKSSIVDAIEFFFTGKISHLEGVQSLSLQRHTPHIKYSLDDVDVEMTFNPGNISLTKTFTSSPIPPDTFCDYFQVTQTGNFIFRRSQILEFIVCKPADRYKTIGSIIGIESLDEIELNMMKLRDGLKQEVESEEKKIKQLFQELSENLEEEVNKFDEICLALNKKLEEYEFPQLESLEDDYKYIEEAYNEAKRKDDSDNKANILGETIDKIKELDIQESALDEIKKLNGIIENRIEDEKKEKVDLLLLNMLETGKKILEEKRMDICPLCSQRIARDEVIESVEQRLKMFRAFSRETSEIQSISTQIVTEFNSVLTKLNFINSRIVKFTEFTEEEKRLQDLIDFMSDFLKQGEDPIQKLPISKIIQNKSELEQLKKILLEKCNQLFENLGLTDKEKRLLKVVRLIEQVKSKAKEISKIESTKESNKKYYDTAEKIYSTFSETKKRRIQNVYDAIQEDMKRFYSALHPGESHGNIELIVDLGRRASTKLKMDLLGQEGEDPRAYASEGHLDSLGLCIFLAFVRKFNENCPLIVLDDVVTTIDAQHRENICKLLLEDFKDKQIILTTHDGIWYEQICASQRAFKETGNFKNMIILDWDENVGPKIKPYKVRWERIQDKILAGDKNGAGNEGRRYLEWILEKICEITRAPIPFNSTGRYETQELFIHARKRLKNLIRDDAFHDDISKAFTELERTMIMGNLLSHNNMDVESVSIEEVNSFCMAVNNLHRIFLCPSCENFLGYYRDLKIMRCSNPNCNHPIDIKTR